MSEVSFEEYQSESAKTAVFPEDKALTYLTLGLTGEAGEFADKVKKIIRDSEGEISPELRELLLKELGDVLWYLTQLCSYFNVSLSEVASMNLAKLFKRMANGTINGSGDER